VLIVDEETIAQCETRMNRIGLYDPNVMIVKMPYLEYIEDIIKLVQPDFLVFDSIQNSHAQELKAQPGNPSQIRHGAKSITNLAKAYNITAFIIGHVTKSNDIAGPKALEHIVDGTLFLDRNAVDNVISIKMSKNRFGSTDKVGMMKMDDRGLAEISDRDLVEMYKDKTVGIVGEDNQMKVVEIVCSIERKVKAKHSISGYNSKRFSMMLKTIEDFSGLCFNNHEVKVEVMPEVEDSRELELSLACHIMAEYLGIDKKGVCFLGELLVSGEVRQTEHLESFYEHVELIGKRAVSEFGNMRSLIAEEFLKFI
jgi:DNA repair protein RadA/Sms